MSESQKQLDASAGRLTWEEKQIQQLKNELRERDEQIERLMEQLYPEPEVVISDETPRRKTDDDRNGVNINSSFIKRVKLSEEMINMENEDET